MVPLDIEDDGDIPPLAEMLYQMYNYDGHDFMLDVIQKVTNSLTQLYPSAEQEERKKQTQVLKLEAIVKFCQYAENLAALALSFKGTYSDGKEEKLGLFKKIAGYGVSEVVDFYTNIAKRDVKYIAKFVGYPPLDLQEQKVIEILEGSCNVIKEEMTKIATFYEEFRSLYDAYKHGYRLFFAKDDNTSDDAFPYIDSEGKQKTVTVSNDTLKNILSSGRQCRNIIRIILQSHNERVKHEENGGKISQVNVPRLKRPNDTPMPENLSLKYPTRGERLQKETKEGDEIYNLFKDDLEKNHNGKIVAIDIDEKKVVALDYDIKKVIEEVKEKGYSGRLRIRRVGKNDKTGIEIY